MLIHCAQKAPSFQASAPEPSRFGPNASSLPLGPSKGAGGSSSPFNPRRGGFKPSILGGTSNKMWGALNMGEPDLRRDSALRR
jgi:hypothetical protein